MAAHFLLPILVLKLPGGWSKILLRTEISKVVYLFAERKTLPTHSKRTLLEMMFTSVLDDFLAQRQLFSVGANSVHDIIYPLPRVYTLQCLLSSYNVMSYYWLAQRLVFSVSRCSYFFSFSFRTFKQTVYLWNTTPFDGPEVSFSQCKLS